MLLKGQINSLLLQVPPGHIWLEGDNLIVSRDSREYGPVPLALVRGRAMVQVGVEGLQLFMQCYETVSWVQAFYKDT